MDCTRMGQVTEKRRDRDKVLALADMLIANSEVHCRASPLQSRDVDIDIDVGSDAIAARAHD